MTNRLNNLDRTLKLVHALSESIEGLIVLPPLTTPIPG